MHVSQHYLKGLGCMSYLVGDEESGEALVIDPQLTIDEYLEEAEGAGLRIAHVLDTHLHADHVSGARALARATGATLWLPGSANAAFEHEKLDEGARIKLGALSLRVRRTPGHTPEHVTYELYDERRSARLPYALFTGDTLFVGSVGRPDLVGTSTPEKLARQLHESVTRTLAAEDDASLVYPGHGAGSACGASMGHQLHTTLGYEKRTNRYFGLHEAQRFVDEVVRDLPPKPGNAAAIKRINTQGPPEEPLAPEDVRALSPDEFARAVGDGRRVLVLDTSEPDAFAANHVPGSINVTLAAAQFPNRAAYFLEWGLPVYLVLPDDEDLGRALVGLARVGATEIKGYLRDGIHAWRSEGKPFATIPTVSVQDARRLAEEGEAPLLDVRSDKEWAEGHAPGAIHAPWEGLVHERGGLARDAAWAVVCGSGYRSSTAASLLRREGFTDVRNVLGGMAAWRKAGEPIERPAATKQEASA